MQPPAKTDPRYEWTPEREQHIRRIARIGIEEKAAHEQRETHKKRVADAERAAREAPARAARVAEINRQYAERLERSRDNIARIGIHHEIQRSKILASPWAYVRPTDEEAKREMAAIPAEWVAAWRQRRDY